MVVDTAGCRVHAAGISTDERPDAAVVTALRTGDEQEFRRLVLELTPAMLVLARRYVPTPSAAEDVVQETWLTVLSDLDGFEGRSSLRTWIFGILINKARRVGVREHRQLPFSSVRRQAAVDPDRFHPTAAGDRAPAGTWASPPFRWDLEPEERLTAQELRRVIETAIAALPTRQRDVITLRDVLGMDAAEAGELLGLTATNQRVLLHRARSQVRAVLERYGRDALGSPLDEGRR